MATGQRAKIIRILSLEPTSSKMVEAFQFSLALVSLAHITNFVMTLHPSSKYNAKCLKFEFYYDKHRFYPFFWITADMDLRTLSTGARMLRRLLWRRPPKPRRHLPEGAGMNKRAFGTVKISQKNMHFPLNLR